jgi:hypothetical protein
MFQALLEFAVLNKNRRYNRFIDSADRGIARNLEAEDGKDLKVLQLM